MKNRTNRTASKAQVIKCHKIVPFWVSESTMGFHPSNYRILKNLLPERLKTAAESVEDCLFETVYNGKVYNGGASGYVVVTDAHIITITFDLNTPFSSENSAIPSYRSAIERMEDRPIPDPLRRVDR